MSPLAGTGISADNNTTLISRILSPFRARRSNNGRYSQLSPEEGDSSESAQFLNDDGINTGSTEDEHLHLSEKPQNFRRLLSIRQNLAAWKLLFGMLLLPIGAWIMFSFLKWLLLGRDGDFDCSNARYVYNGATTVYSVPIGEAKHEHFFNVRGGAVGNILLTQGDNTSQAVTVELTLRTDDVDLLRSIVVEQHDPSPNSVKRGFWRLNTPRIARGDGRCIYYDAIVRVPPTLRKLHVAAHSVARVVFDDAPGTNVTLDDLFVTFFSQERENVLVASTGIRATRTQLEMAGGRMEGRVALFDETRLLTQRGAAQAAVEVVMLPFAGAAAQAVLHTVTGVGRAQFTLDNPFRRAADIVGDHLSAGNGDVELHYENAGFNGHVDVEARAWTGHGRLPTGDKPLDTGTSDEDASHASRETRWIGDKDGRDVVTVRSLRGTVGLWF